MFSEERVNCPECGDTRKRLYIKKVPGGYIRHCHNNNCYAGRGYVPDAPQTPKETIKQIISSRNFGETSNEQVVRNIQLPRDATTKIPTIGLGWLYKYYITDEEIKKYNICYSEQYPRLILPVYSGEELIYWQGRSFKLPYTKDNPKYLNIRQSGAKNVFFKVEDIHYTDNTLVVVEDILSAIRVGRTHNSLALLGSYFPSIILNEFRGYENIIIYLDHDKWTTAIKASIKFNKLTGKRFIVKDHLLDPKVLSPLDLEKFLTET
jgi:hypothetical protein